MPKVNPQSLTDNLDKHCWTWTLGMEMTSAKVKCLGCCRIGLGSDMHGHVLAPEEVASVEVEGIQDLVWDQEQEDQVDIGTAQEGIVLRDLVEGVQGHDFQE